LVLEMRVRHLPPERARKEKAVMRRNDLQLVQAVEDKSSSVDLAEILVTSPAPTPVLRVVPTSEEDVTPDDAA
jgi:hypothetical protein